MDRKTVKGWSKALLLAGGIGVMAVSSGCQTTVGGQTLPSAYYLLDDVQYFPAGPEFVLTREVEEHENYRLRQQSIQQGIDPNAIGP
jgi:hypothetical protein